MATFKICVFEHQKRADSKYPVSIRVTNNRKTSYLKTGIYAVRGQISRDFKTLKDIELARSIDRQIQKYEKIVSDQLGAEVTTLSVKELCDFLVRQSNNSNQIDFVEFSRSHIKKTFAANRESSGRTFETVVRSLIDFFEREQIFIKEITVKSLTDYENYLLSERKMVRKDQFGRVSYITKPGVSSSTIADYMKTVRVLFNAAINEYNDDDMGISLITHYPFRKYKVKTNHVTKNRNLDIDIIRKIRDVAIMEEGSDKLVRLASDIFMMSFYSIGTNLIDLYNITDCNNGRITYNRSKTATRRDDHAHISIRIEPEFEKLMTKYIDKTNGRVFNFYKSYSTSKNFIRAVNKGLKRICEITGSSKNVTSYYARHSWATLARNNCRVPLENINMALNHVDSNMKVTDIYIAKDWSIIDDANRQVLDLLK